jgi:UDP-N-acetylmuramyl tripeptide synthase
MKYVAIFCAKLVILLGKILKRGSSMPGKIALKIDKNLLKKMKMPNKIIAVTGSSGKGSTSSILAQVYRKMGYKVVHNSSGANLKAGITPSFIILYTAFLEIPRISITSLGVSISG